MDSVQKPVFERPPVSEWMTPPISSKLWKKSSRGSQSSSDTRNPTQAILSGAEWYTPHMTRKAVPQRKVPEELSIEMAPGISITLKSPRSSRSYDRVKEKSGKVSLKIKSPRHRRKILSRLSGRSSSGSTSPRSVESLQQSEVEPLDISHLDFGHVLTQRDLDERPIGKFDFKLFIYFLFGVLFSWYKRFLTSDIVTHSLILTLLSLNPLVWCTLLPCGETELNRWRRFHRTYGW